MRVIVDTNVVCRLAQTGHAQHPVSLKALDVLNARGETVWIVPQVLYEFWVVCTRPQGDNGLGLGTAEACAEQDKALALFKLLPDSAAVFPVWQDLVTRYDVKGRNAHDARLVAAMIVHGVDHMLTFNGADFARYPNITILAPASILPPVASP